MPCAITGKAGDNIHPHHADVIGRQQIQNDYYAIPLIYYKHTGNSGHITLNKLERETGEDPRDLAMFYMSMYIEQLEGRYNSEMDQSTNHLTFRRKSIGKE